MTDTLKAGPKRAVTATPIDWSVLGPADHRRLARFAQQYVQVPKGKGAGEPFRLRPWQREITRAILPAKGKRPRQGLISLPRGNGKSTVGALLALYALLADDVASPQVLLCAADLRQAGIIFNAARRMVETSPELAARVRIYQDRLVSPLNDGVIMPLPSDPDALQGWDPSLCLVDELHVVDRDCWESMILASGKRPESLVLAISTPPANPDSVMRDLAVMARSEPSPDFYFREWTSDPSHPIDCTHCERASNPALGDFLSADALSSVRRTSREASYRRYRLGQWIEVSEDSWLTPEAWKACESPRQIEDGSPVVLAFDGSYSGDATAIVACSVESVPHLQPVAVWEPEGRPEFRVPIADVEDALRAACTRWRVVEVACDPFRWQKSLQALAAEGLPMAEFGQSRARMTPATQSLTEAVLNGEVTHAGDAALTRHVLNARVTDDHTGVRLHKADKHSEHKIDLAVCSVMAHSRARHYAAQKPEPTKSRRVWSF